MQPRALLGVAETMEHFLLAPLMFQLTFINQPFATFNV